MFENNKVADSAFGAAMKVVVLIIFLLFYVIILLQYTPSVSKYKMF